METSEERLLYIDNLRVLMIVFVIVQHLAVTYSGFGSWYYKEGGIWAWQRPFCSVSVCPSRRRISWGSCL